MDKLRILIADDDYDIITSMFIMLKSKGFDVITAGSGEEALAKYEECKPHIILLDLMMEKFDTGVTVCRKIREKDKEVKIYLISAVGEESSNNPEAQDIGFTGMMSKPVTPEKLVKLLG